MTRESRHLIVLALIAIALVAVVLWVGRREYVLDPPTITGLGAGAVTRVSLDIPSLSPQVFERRRDGWWRVRPSAARADGPRVERLARLAETPVARWLPGGDVDPAKLGLARPSATLKLNGVHLEYGGLTPIGGLRYVAVGDKVALVPRQYSPEVMLTKPGRD